MCPACVATLAMIAAGTISIGGLGAHVVNTFRAKTSAQDAGAAIQSHGDENDSSANRVAI